MSHRINYFRLIRTLALPGLALILFSFSGCTKKASASRSATEARPAARYPSTAPSGPGNEAAGILYYVNLHRHLIGLPPLQMDKVESSVAARHSRDMATGKVPFGHMGLQSRVDAIKRQLGNVLAQGENVAYGQRSPREVVADWLESPGHRANIEGNFRLTGIGLARDSKGVIYYTQIFTR